MPAQNSAKPDVPSELEICVRPDVQSHGLLCFFNIFQRSTTTLSEVLGAAKAKAIQAGFLVECIPLTLQRARRRKSWGPQKPNQFKQVSWWNAFRGHCQVPAKLTAPVAKRYVKQHATACFEATSFLLKGLHIRPVQSQSVEEREVWFWATFHSFHLIE